MIGHSDQIEGNISGLKNIILWKLQSLNVWSELSSFFLIVCAGIPGNVRRLLLSRRCASTTGNIFQLLLAVAEAAQAAKTPQKQNQHAVSSYV